MFMNFNTVCDDNEMILFLKMLKEEDEEIYRKAFNQVINQLGDDDLRIRFFKEALNE